MLNLSTVVKAFKGSLQVNFIKETQGESGASAVQFIVQDLKNKSKFRLCLFSKGLQELFDSADRDVKWLYENAKDLRINSYVKVDEETNTSYTVYQLKHKDEESKVKSAMDMFDFGDEEVEELALGTKDLITPQAEFDLFVNSFEYDTRNIQSQEVNENAINSAVAGVGAGEE